jgi:hypothetical protein
MDGDSNFVVTWKRILGLPPGPVLFTIYARRFDASGNPAGDEFEVAAATGNGFPHSIAMSDAGHFAIVWQRTVTAGCVDGPYATPSQCDDILLRRYDNQAQPQGKPIVVAGGKRTFDQYPVVAMDRLGRFVVVWQRHRDLCRALDRCDDIHARRYDASGDVLGSLTVLADGRHADTTPRVAMNGSGAFSVMWQRNRDAPLTGSADVLFRAYDAAGLNLTGIALQPVAAGMSTSKMDNRDPTVGIDDSGALHLAWSTLSDKARYGTHHALVYRRLTPSEW